MLLRPTAFALAFTFGYARLRSTQALRYGNQGDLKSLDPYTLNETTTLAHLGHVYEGLVARDKNLNIVPALAESWKRQSLPGGVFTCDAALNFITATTSQPTM